MVLFQPCWSSGQRLDHQQFSTKSSGCLCAHSLAQFEAVPLIDGHRPVVAWSQCEPQLCGDLSPPIRDSLDQCVSCPSPTCSRSDPHGHQFCCPVCLAHATCYTQGCGPVTDILRDEIEFHGIQSGSPAALRSGLPLLVCRFECRRRFGECLQSDVTPQFPLIGRNLPDAESHFARHE